MGKAIIINGNFNNSLLNQVTFKGAEVIELESIQITNKVNEITNNYQLEFGYTPTNTTQKGVTFNSSDSSIINVNSLGYCQVLKEGNVTITVTSTKNLSIKDTVSITGKFATVATTGINITTLANKIELNDNVIFSANVMPTNASNKEINWVVSNCELISSNNSTATVKASNVGNASITANQGLITKTYNFVVTEKEVIEPPVNPDLPEGVVYYLSSENYISGNEWSSNIPDLPATLVNNITKNDDSVVFNNSSDNKITPYLKVDLSSIINNTNDWSVFFDGYSSASLSKTMYIIGVHNNFSDNKQAIWLNNYGSSSSTKLCFKQPGSSAQGSGVSTENNGKYVITKSGGTFTFYTRGTDGNILSYAYTPSTNAILESFLSSPTFILQTHTLSTSFNSLGVDIAIKQLSVYNKKLSNEEASNLV